MTSTSEPTSAPIPAVGAEVEHKGQRARVVRRCDDQVLFTPQGEPPYLLCELYSQVITAQGEIDFVVHRTTRLPYTGQQSTIEGLTPFNEKSL